MASGRRRIRLRELSGHPSLWDRLFGGFLRPSEELSSGNSVDYRLRHRTAIRSVRSFVESIDSYELHTRRTVHVVSHYRIPSDQGLQTLVPEWLAERVRFGVVGAGGEIEYLPIRSVDVAWDGEGTELFLRLVDRVLPGTHAFIAAYLGDGSNSEELADLPVRTQGGGPR